MNHIILASHSKLATGFKNTLCFFKPDIEVDVIEQYENDTGIENALEHILIKNKDKNCIVFTDLYGGSVNQIAFKKLRNYSFYLITGMNLAVVLEIAFANEDVNEEFIINAIKMAKEQLCFMNYLL